MNKCSKCGKPVYFAERKTSLGRDWHPSCLRCEECGKILTPGQHAEHKGLPYCNTPCYKALFGPKLFGYGANLYSPSNFKQNRGVNGTPVIHEDEDEDERTMIYQSMTERPHELMRHLPNQKSPVKSRPISTPVNIESRYTPSSVHSRHTGPTQPSENQELLKKVKAYNTFHESKRGLELSVTEEKKDVIVKGPLRIYWGVLKPIHLKQCDDIPSASASQASWRHSYYPGATRNSAELDSESTESTKFLSPTPNSPRLGRGLDDSSISSPGSDGVVRRRNIKKYNTVAYRGDDINRDRWKRASINGHIYNFDTRIFTPFLGTCTSVNVNNKMTAFEVIAALLDKFKVENKAGEYRLYLVNENDSERLLKDSDNPLLERLALGADAGGTKLFLKDKTDDDSPGPTMEAWVKEVTLDEEEEEVQEEEKKPEPILPAEVLALVNLPEMVLRGILHKFEDDEEKAVQKVKFKYQRIQKYIAKRLTERETWI